MGKVRVVKCPHCGAPLPPFGEARVVRCEYCTRDVELSTTKARPAVGPGPSPSQPPPPARPAVFAAIGFAVTAAVTGVIIAIVSRHNERARVAAPQLAAIAERKAAEDAKAHLPPAERRGYYWVGSGVLPVIRDVDGDGVEDVIGRVRFIDDGDVIRVFAFSGRDQRVLWRSPPYGTWGESGYQHIRVTLVGDRLLVTDTRGDLHLLDVATGQEQAKHTLGERAARICLTADGKGATIALTDETARQVAADGTVTTVPRSAACKADPFACGSMWRPQSATCLPRGLPRIDGMSPEFGVAGPGGARLVSGRKWPGTARPMLAGLPAKGAQPIWMREVSQGDPLAVAEQAPDFVDVIGGVGYVFYEMRENDEARVQAFDPATGAVRWDVEVPTRDSIFDVDGVAASATRLYVAHDHTLDILDVGTGKPIASIGWD